MLTFDPPDTEDCLFHCQQAVEKCLKALLVWHDQPFRKTHDLIELTQQCAVLEPNLWNALRGLGPLTRFAWESRYPGEASTPPLDTAHNWLVKAEEVLTAIDSVLPSEVRSQRHDL